MAWRCLARSPSPRHRGPTVDESIRRRDPRVKDLAVALLRKHPADRQPLILPLLALILRVAADGSGPTSARARRPTGICTLTPEHLRSPLTRSNCHRCNRPVADGVGRERRPNDRRGPALPGRTGGGFTRRAGARERQAPFLGPSTARARRPRPSRSAARAPGIVGRRDVCPNRRPRVEASLTASNPAPTDGRVDLSHHRVAFEQQTEGRARPPRRRLDRAPCTPQAPGRGAVISSPGVA
jgi:hypothetical protein